MWNKNNNCNRKWNMIVDRERNYNWVGVQQKREYVNGRQIQRKKP